MVTSKSHADLVTVKTWPEPCHQSQRWQGTFLKTKPLEKTRGKRFHPQHETFYCSFCLDSCLCQQVLPVTIPAWFSSALFTLSSRVHPSLTLWTNFLQGVVLHWPTFQSHVRFVCLRTAFATTLGLGHFAERCCSGQNFTCNQDEAWSLFFTKEMLKVTVCSEESTWDTKGAGPSE